MGFAPFPIRQGPVISLYRLLYRFTSLPRVIDPRYPTNRAVLLLLPPAAGVAGAMAFLRGSGLPGVGEAAFWGVAVTVGGWSLARELVPDLERVAFVSLLLTFGAFLTVESSSLLILYSAVFQVRIVTRSVGLPPRAIDSVFVTALTVWGTFAASFPGVALTGALAFGLDASMAERARRQWIYSGICLAAAGVCLNREGLPGLSESLPATAAGLLLLLGLGYGLTMWRTRSVASLADVTGKLLSSARARAGMAVGFLVGLQSLTRGLAGLEAAALVWAAVAGVSLGALAWPRR